MPVSRFCPSRARACHNADHALATCADSGATGLPRTASVPAIAMRAPFLSPASRPTSSLWSPPSFPHPHPYPYGPAQASSSSSALQGGAPYASRYPSYADIHAHLRKGRRVLPSSRCV